MRIGTGIDSSVTASLSKNDGDARAYVLGNGRRTGHEYLYAYDFVSGKVLAMHTNGLVNGVDAPDALKESLNDRTRKIVVHHNHPNSMPPSISDVLSVGSFRGLHLAYIHGHDGTFYKITPRQRGNIEKATEAIGEVAKLFSRDAEFAVLTDSDYTLLVALSRINALSSGGFIDVSSNVSFDQGSFSVKIGKMTEVMVAAVLRATRQDG